MMMQRWLVGLGHGVTMVIRACWCRKCVSCSYKYVKVFENEDEDDKRHFGKCSYQLLLLLPLRSPLPQIHISK